MGNDAYRTADAAELRRRAEERVRENDARSALAGEFPGSPEEVRAAVHELQVRQIELELQNEELRRAEAALRESEARYRQLAEQRGTIAWEVDSQGLYTYVSPVAEQVCGYRPDELVGRMHFYDLHPESGREAFKTAAFAVFERRESFRSLVNPIETKDHRVVWVSTSGLPLLSADGTLRGYRGSDTDITERRAAEEQLRRLSIAVEQSPVSIVITNLAGDIEYVNPKFIDVTGYTRAEATGQNPRVLKSGDRGPDAYRELWETISAGRVWRGEFHNRRKDGQLYWESASISPIRDASGRITHFLAVKEDITARKQVEEELQATNRSLEEATARAHALAAEAARANEAKSDFLANMSHEIRTPMNGVIGMTGLLLDTALNEEQRRFAEIVRSSGEALLALLNDILDFSKIEAGKLEMETLDFDLRALLDDFAATMALRAHDKGVEFICATAPDVPAYLRGDPGRLRQILTNLAGNAVKFTHEGEIVVRAGLVSETDAEAVIRFSIRDTGIGIPSDKQAPLFQKFTQADASTTRHYGGTGLGLAISKQLAEMMGGQIGLVSEQGQGSEFWFTARLTKQAERASAESLPLADLRGAHVLIVDDNATNRQVLLAQLQAWGVRSEEAPGSRAALQDLRRARDAGDPFRAAIVDMQMPDMDGAELARAIKSDAALQSTRLVLMTSLGQRGDARKMEELGFAAYLTKPVRRDEVIGSLSLVLADGAATAPPPPLVTRHAIRELRRGLTRILLAEDNITNQQVAVGLLKRLGLRADAVANGAEAIRALESLPYDLVLMDVQMPEMGGLEATRRIRDPQSAVRNHEIPIIAMTASAMESDRAECLDAGMNDYVSKPVSPGALADALDRWLPKETAAAAEPASAAEPPVFDQAGFLARVGDDDEFARVLVKGFLDDLPRQIKVMQDHLEAGGTEEALRQAHTIKGAAANMGGEALRAVALRMEDSLRSGSPEAASALLPELEVQVVRLREALERHLRHERCA